MTGQTIKIWPTQTSVYASKPCEITHQLEALFDAGIAISLAEELRLQAIVECLIEDANTFLQKK